ncbi:hypothetical protein SCALM49S_05232 [Streptomyces californicus]
MVHTSIRVSPETAGRPASHPVLHPAATRGGEILTRRSHGSPGHPPSAVGPAEGAGAAAGDAAPTARRWAHPSTRRATADFPHGARTHPRRPEARKRWSDTGRPQRVSPSRPRHPPPRPLAARNQTARTRSMHRFFEESLVHRCTLRHRIKPRHRGVFCPVGLNSPTHEGFPSLRTAPHPPRSVNRYPRVTDIPARTTTEPRGEDQASPRPSRRRPARRGRRLLDPGSRARHGPGDPGGTADLHDRSRRRCGRSGPPAPTRTGGGDRPRLRTGKRGGVPFTDGRHRPERRPLPRQGQGPHRRPRQRRRRPGADRPLRRGDARPARPGAFRQQHRLRPRLRLPHRDRRPHRLP